MCPRSPQNGLGGRGLAELAVEVTEERLRGVALDEVYALATPLLDDRADLFDKILLTHLQGAGIDRDGQAFGCWIGRPASQLTAGDF